jgi:cytochrome P450
MASSPSVARRPCRSWLLGDLPAYNRDRLGFFRWCAQEVGDFVPLRFGSVRLFMLNHPDLIEQVMVTEHRNFTKSVGLRRSRVLFGNGLLTSEGAFWRRQRKLVQPAFHRERIAAYAQSMVEITQHYLQDWEEGQTRDIHADMMRLTLNIAVKTLFGAEVTAGEQVANAMEVGQNAFSRWIPYLVMLPNWIPTPSTPRLSQAIRQLDQVVYGLIHARRASGEDKGDLLAMLLRAQDEDDGTVMTDQQLRDEILTLFLAGHETTALVLTWTFYLLAQHPEVEARLHAELQGVLNGRAPHIEDRPQLKYTEQIILESMRLYPPAWSIGREAVQACEIGGYTLPAHATVMMSPYVMHRDARYFPDPDTFDPDRWAGDAASHLPRYAYFPFGGGPRICIGNTFAMLESILVLATISAQFRLRLAQEHPVIPQPSFTLRPQDGIRMQLCPQR